MPTLDETLMLKNLVYLCCLIYPTATAMSLHRNWERHKVLGDYDEPSYAHLQQWVREFRV